jgi:hypothetical protein
MNVIKTAITLLGATGVAATQDTPSIVMNSLVMVCHIDGVCGTRLEHLFADINECNSTTSNACQQICTNIPGSYTCQCNSGYRLNSDERSCAGI